MEEELACRKDILFKTFFFFLMNKIIRYIQGTFIKPESLLHIWKYPEST